MILDTAALDDLERKLIVAERDFIESDLERRIEEMRVARVTQVKFTQFCLLNNKVLVAKKLNFDRING
jgi:hypothetical protein